MNVEILNKQNIVRICNKLIQRPHSQYMIVGRTLYIYVLFSPTNVLSEDIFHIVKSLYDSDLQDSRLSGLWWAHNQSWTTALWRGQIRTPHLFRYAAADMLSVLIRTWRLHRWEKCNNTFIMVESLDTWIWAAGWTATRLRPIGRRMSPPNCQGISEDLQVWYHLPRGSLPNI